MKGNLEIYHRRSSRLKGYDYSQPAIYFITICAQNRDCLFGEIADEKMKLNDAGKMIEKWYFELMNKFPDILCGEHVVMPNHFHCIIHNVGADLRVCLNENVNADLRVCPNKGQSHRIAPTANTYKTGEHTGSGEPTDRVEHIGSGEHTGSPLRNVIQWFKTMTTNEYIHHVKHDGWKPFDGKLWQRNYYEHIIRNEIELKGSAGETVRKKLLAECDVHTLLRLPRGVFYAQGVKANVLFFDRKPASEKPWTEKLWIYDLRTNQHFTLKTNPLRYEDLKDFIQCYNPENRFNRKETERFKAFTCDELMQRDKVSLDIFWLKDESLEDSENLPPPDIIAREIMENLESALEQFYGIYEDLKHE